MEKKYLTRSEIAEMLRMSVPSVNYLTKTKQIPFIRIGKRAIRFDPDEITEWMETRKNLDPDYQTK